MNYTLHSGSHDEQGRRDTMEDTHIHLDVVCCEGSAPFRKVSYYGVYDGHGGVREFAKSKLMTQKTTADIVKEELHKAIFATQEFQDGKPEDSFVQGFQQVDKIVVDKANAEGWMNGTTAVG